MRNLLGIAVVLSLGACAVGPRASRVPVATGPRGTAADLRLKGVRVRGELLDVRDTGLVILRDARVVFVPLAAIGRGDFAPRGMLVAGGEYVSDEAAALLRRLARYPMGLSAERWATLLAAYGQTELDGPTP